MKLAKSILGVAFFHLASINSVISQSYTLDSTFSDDGKVIAKFGKYNDRPHSIALQLDKKILVVGSTYNGQNESDTTKSMQDILVMRYNENGSLDSLFSEDGKVIISVGRCCDANDIKLQTDGKILIAGYIGIGDCSNYSRSFLVLRLTTNGVLDKTFSDEGIFTTSINHIGDEAEAICIQKDGKILVGGSTYFYGNVKRQLTLLRLNVDGSMDRNFAENGIAINRSGDNNSCNSLVIQEDGKILAAGNTIIRYLVNGNMDPTFGINGLIYPKFGQTDFSINTIALLRNGKMVASGFTRVEDDRAFVFAAAVYTSNGSLDKSKLNNGYLITEIGTSSRTVMVLSNEDIVLIAGTGEYINEKLHRSPKFNLISIELNGGIIHELADKNIMEGYVRAIQIQRNGKVLVAGSTESKEKPNNNYESFSIARYKFSTDFNTVRVRQLNLGIDSFAKQVFNTIKKNDLNTFLAILPEAPLTPIKSVVNRGNKPDTVVFGVKEYQDLRDRLSQQFQFLVTAMKLEGIVLEDIHLSKILVEYDSDSDFKAIEVYLLIYYNNIKYKIRIEDCVWFQNGFLPESLKWFSQKEKKW